MLLVPAALAAQSPSTAEIDAVFARWDKPNSPGCALGVIRDGKLVYTRGYGSENLDYGLPLSDSSVFYLASVSKQFTAASIALAARQGKLSLDDDVRKWIPELPDYGHTITIRNLIHHTSGIRDYLSLVFLGAQRLEDVMTDEDMLSLISRQKSLNFAPGSEYSYSNSGYVLLGIVLKRATGKSLREFADEYLFRPLGMTHTHFHDQPRNPIRNRAVGYDRDSSGFVMDHLWNFDRVGDGGLYSTVEDLYRWDQNFYHDRIGGPGFIEQLQTTEPLTGGAPSTYAFGLQVDKYRGLKIVDHGGSMMGFRTDILRFPEQHFSAIALCNVSEANPGTLVRKVAELYLGSQMGPPVAALTHSSVADTSSAQQLEPAELRAYSGTYRSEELGAVYRVRAESGRLLLDPPFSHGVVLRSLARDRFTGRSSTSGPINIEFTRDGSGTINGFKLASGRIEGLTFRKE